MSGDTRSPTRPGQVPAWVIEDLKKRFRGFPVPVPDGILDPSTASVDDLRKYGLPPKPDPSSQALLREAWDEGFGRAMRLERFDVDRALVDAADYRPHRRHVDAIPFSETRFETSSNWSGAYVTANQGKQFLQIWGLWTIPASLQLPPPSLQGPQGVPYVCANWIGLDGQRLYLDSSLPQIGTTSTLQANGTTTAQAWTQWWARQDPTTAPVPIALTVNPSNEVLCVLTAIDPQTVIFVMVNLSSWPPTGTAVLGSSPTVKLPDGSNVNPNIAGATAEWIVERPRIVGQPTMYNFPDYGKTEFDLCIAVEGDGVSLLSLPSGLPQQLQGARRIRMFDVLTDPARTTFISMPRKLSETSVRVRYGGFR